MYLQRRRLTKSFARDCFFILLLFFYVLFFYIIILITCYRYIDIYATYIICGVRRVNDVRDMCADYVARIYTRGAYNVEKKICFIFLFIFFYSSRRIADAICAIAMCIALWGRRGLGGTALKYCSIYAGCLTTGSHDCRRRCIFKLN